jgi:hypothetical protein
MTAVTAMIIKEANSIAVNCFMVAAPSCLAARKRLPLCCWA